MKLKVSRPVAYLALATVAVAAFLMVSEEGARKGRPNRATTTRSTVDLPEGFTQEDLTASFPRLQDSARDAFRPLVVRKSAGSEVGVTPDAIPGILTGGDPNWVYTGMAEVDGVPMGLLENRSTGDGTFVKHADRWRNASVRSISPNQIVLVGDSGKEYTIQVVNPTMSGSSVVAGTQPVQPNLRGPIGTNVEITPVPGRGRGNLSAGAPRQMNEPEAIDGN